MKRILFSLLLLAGFLSVSTTQLAAQDQNIVEIAAANDNFSTLVTAVKAAGLAETLSGEGPFTVFAPTDEAFAALPAGLVEALVKPENKETLQKILTYHVVPNELMAEDVMMGIKKQQGTLMATTVAGSKFSVMTEMGKVKIKDAQGNIATVTATDIAGTNGVIHVIDKVILPQGVNPADLLKDKAMSMAKTRKAASRASEPMAKSMKPMGPSIATVATGNDNFKTLVKALSAASLVETFDAPGEYTVFAPTDDAFGKLPEGTVNTLVREQKAKLKSVLAYHVIPATLTADKLIAAIKANGNYYKMQTLGGQTIVATLTNGSVELIDGNGGRARVVMTDVEASNGIIHAIDTVVMPK